MRKILSSLLVLLVASSALAGGAACVIIVNCGYLQSKGAELKEYPSEVLRLKAAELETLEGELCDLAPHITEYLNRSEKEEVVRRAALAWAFGEKLQRYMDEWKSKSTKDEKALADEMQAFMDDQASFFRGLADKYKFKE